MAITKTGGIIMGSLMGALRSGDLSDEQRRALADHYELPEDASFGLRNAGRGVVGGTLGGIAGAMLTGRAGVALMGDVIGSYLGTGKYSKSNAERLVDRDRRRAKLMLADKILARPDTVNGMRPNFSVEMPNYYNAQ